MKERGLAREFTRLAVPVALILGSGSTLALGYGLYAAEMGLRMGQELEQTGGYRIKNVSESFRRIRILGSADGEKEDGKYSASQAIWGPWHKIQEARNRAYYRALSKIDASCEIIRADKDAMLVMVRNCQ